MSKQYATNKQIEELEQRLTNKIAMLQADLKNYKQEMGQLRSENRELREENQALKREIESNKESINAAEVKADDLENRQRRNNLVFHGIGGDEIRETWEHVEEKVKEFVQRDLQIGSVTIERAHRSGVIRGNKPRPVVALFSSWKEKEAVKKKARELKNSSIFTTEDYSYRVRSIRRKLMDFADKNKKQDSKYHLRFDKLILDSKAYKYDEMTDQVTECSRSNQRQPSEERDSQNHRGRRGRDTAPRRGH